MDLVLGTVKPKSNQIRGSAARKESAYDFLGTNIIIHQMPDDKIGKIWCDKLG